MNAGPRDKIVWGTILLTAAEVCLRDHAATDLNIYCTVFPGVIFRFLGEFSMHIKPFQPSNGLLVLKMPFRYDHSKQ